MMQAGKYKGKASTIYLYFTPEYKNWNDGAEVEIEYIIPNKNKAPVLTGALFFILLKIPGVLLYRDKEIMRYLLFRTGLHFRAVLKNRFPFVELLRNTF